MKREAEIISSKKSKKNKQKKKNTKKFKKKFVTNKSNNELRNQIIIENIEEYFQSLPPPIFARIKSKIKANPIKRKTKQKNIVINVMNNNNNINIDNSSIKNSKYIIKSIQKSEDTNKYIIEQNNIKMELNEKQMYEKYLLISKLTDLELNNLPYKNAIKLEKRSYCAYYISLIRSKHILFFSFFQYLIIILEY